MTVDAANAAKNDVTVASDDKQDGRVRPQAPLWMRPLAASAFWVLLVDVVLVLIFGAIAPVYLTVASFQNIAVAATELVILAVGFALLLGAAQFDLSLGANLVVSSVAGAEVLSRITGVSPTATVLHDELLGALLGLLACILCGAVVGALNGLIVTRLRVNSLIATLGTTGIATGIALVITNGGDLTAPPSLQSDFGNATVGQVPLIAIVAIVVAVVATLMLRVTRTGLRLLAIGSLLRAAQRAGIRVDRFVLVLFVAMGALAGLTGFIDLSRFASTSVSSHTLDALNAGAAAVIGGTAMFGGRVSIPGAVCGALLAAILQTGLVTVGLASFYQQIVVGGVLIVAVSIDQFRRGRSEEG